VPDLLAMHSAHRWDTVACRGPLVRQPSPPGAACVVLSRMRVVVPTPRSGLIVQSWAGSSLAKRAAALLLPVRVRRSFMDHVCIACEQTRRFGSDACLAHAV
jgi:hypothetical protein